MELADISTSISQLSEEEALELVLERREVRREDYRQSSSSSSSSSKKKDPKEVIEEQMKNLSKDQKDKLKTLLG